MRTAVTTTTEYTVVDQERMKAAQNYFQWQASLAERELGRRILEIGCGIGNFSEHLRTRELVVGIDVDENCVSRWRRRFVDQSQYEGLLLSAESPEFRNLKRYKVDSIACLNVLEHIEHDGAVLRGMKDILPSGGRVVLIVPAFESLYGKIDACLGHYRRYSKRSLTLLAEAAGLRPRVLKYMNAVGAVGWWVNAKILKRSEQSEKQIAFFDSYIVPPLSRLEGWISPPIGQSIVATLEKI